MPRVCNREGCGKRIVAKDGTPDYRKHFCGAVCLKIDKRERVQSKRARLDNRRCPHCGRKPPLPVFHAVSRGTSAVPDAFSDSRVKLHEAQDGTNEVAAEADG